MLQSLDAATWNGAVTIRAAAAVEEVAQTISPPAAVAGGFVVSANILATLEREALPTTAAAFGAVALVVLILPGAAARRCGRWRRCSAERPCSRAWWWRSTSASTFSASSPFRSRSASASNTRSTSSTATGRITTSLAATVSGRAGARRRALLPHHHHRLRIAAARPATRALLSVRPARRARRRSAAWRWPSWRYPPRSPQSPAHAHAWTKVPLPRAGCLHAILHAIETPHARGAHLASRPGTSSLTCFFRRVGCDPVRKGSRRAGKSPRGEQRPVEEWAARPRVTAVARDQGRRRWFRGGGGGSGAEAVVSAPRWSFKGRVKAGLQQPVFAELVVQAAAADAEQARGLRRLFPAFRGR